MSYYQLSTFAMLMVLQSSSLSGAKCWVVDIVDLKWWPTIFCQDLCENDNALEH
jgi:hypothetical protein